MKSWKNFFIFLVVRFFQLFQSQKWKDNFLIVTTTGLGDTLWATPALRSLRTSFPHAYIACLTTPLGAQVLEHNPALDEIFVFKKTSSLLSLYFSLRRKKIGTILVFHTSQRIILPFCATLGASRLIGTGGLQKGLDSLLTTSLPWNNSHEIERRLDMAREAGAACSSYDLEFFVTDIHRQQASCIIPTGAVIGLHPGSKDRFKQWPAEYFIQLGKRLKEERGCTLVVTGVPAEQQLVEDICREIGNALAMIQPLKVMGALLEKFSLFITNDTGPLHLAIAMKTPTIALFAPTNPAICGPYHTSNTEVMRAPPTCFPCLRKKCHNPFCMRQISPEQVLQKVLERLKAVENV